MKLGITKLIHNKDYIEFVTEFPCFLGHPVWSQVVQCKLKKTLRPCAKLPFLFTFLIKYASSLNFQDNKRIEKKECCVIERKTIFYRNRFLMKFKTFNEKRMKKVWFNYYSALWTGGGNVVSMCDCTNRVSVSNNEPKACTLGKYST